MLKTKAQNLKSLSHRNLSQVELTFNSNDDLNTLLGENSKVNLLFLYKLTFSENILLLNKKLSLFISTYDFWNYFMTHHIFFI